MDVPYTLRARIILALNDLGSAATTSIAHAVQCSYENALLIMAELERERMVMVDRERVWIGNGRAPTFWRLAFRPHRETSAIPETPR